MGLVPVRHPVHLRRRPAHHAEDPEVDPLLARHVREDRDVAAAPKAGHGAGGGHRHLPGVRPDLRDLHPCVGELPRRDRRPEDLERLPVGAFQQDLALEGLAGPAPEA